jgi:hypothetical protein
MTQAPSEDNSKTLSMTKGDHAHTGVRALISAIPIVGSPFEIIFSKYYPSPIDKRRDNLLQSVYEGLEKLKQKYQDITPESLAKNDVFVTVLLNAISVAIRNHQKEKVEALRNAILNTAIRIDIDENMQMILLRYIDILTPLHLKMLALLENPKGYMEKVGRPFPSDIISTGLDAMIQHAIPELHRKREDVRIVFQDLYNNGLINTSPNSLGGTMSVSDSGIFAQRTTDMARVFLRFISAPREIA